MPDDLEQSGTGSPGEDSPVKGADTNVGDVVLTWPAIEVPKFGEALRLLRKRAQMTQLEMQEAAKQYAWAEVSERHLRRFEKGKAIPDLTTVTVMLFLYRKKGLNRWPRVANELRRALMKDVITYLRTAKPVRGPIEPPAAPGSSLL